MLPLNPYLFIYSQCHSVSTDTQAAVKSVLLSGSGYLSQTTHFIQSKLLKKKKKGGHLHRKIIHHSLTFTKLSFRI